MMDEPTMEKQFGCNIAKDKFECKVESSHTRRFVKIILQLVNSLQVPFGGLLLFSNSLIHRSTENQSDKIRWSMDLRWQDPRKPLARVGPDVNAKMPIMRSRENPVDKVDWSVLNDGVRNFNRV